MLIHAAKFKPCNLKLTLHGYKQFILLIFVQTLCMQHRENCLHTHREKKEQIKMFNKKYLLCWRESLITIMIDVSEQFKFMGMAACIAGFPKIIILRAGKSQRCMNWKRQWSYLVLQTQHPQSTLLLSNRRSFFCISDSKWWCNQRTKCTSNTLCDLLWQH